MFAGVDLSLGNMAVELNGFSKMDEPAALQERATAGLKSMENLIKLISNQSQKNRTGHARFRRGPVVLSREVPLSSTAPNPMLSLGPMPVPPPVPAPAPAPVSLTLDFTKPKISYPQVKIEMGLPIPKEQRFSLSPPPTSANSSLLSSITGDGSVSNGKLGPLFLSQIPPAALINIIGKPPLSSVNRKGCHGHENSVFSGVPSGSVRCHCAKKKKLRIRRAIRVPAISSKIADIPSDNHSWRKYGQKPIKGSPYPRGYYRCSSVRGCPAKKHVERARDDPTMLIVTYEGEHRHSEGAAQVIEAPGLTLALCQR